jgi:hypothetical protein
MSLRPKAPGMAVAAAAAAAWSYDDTERWLTDYPLPAAFMWNGTRAYPRYNLKKGYGFWLRTAGPYHPALRGLFMLAHEILYQIPVGQSMPSGDELAALLLRQVGRQAALPLSAEDQAAPAATNPAENTPSI